jgi:acyl-coenzyme A thioesterase PaaI-like protein
MVINQNHTKANPVTRLRSSIGSNARKIVQTWLGELLAVENPNSWQLHQLSFCFQLALPFNRDHRLKVVKLSPNHAEILLPLIKSNTNHLGGLHACALVTAGELSTGALLLKAFPPTEYRLLLSQLTIDYKRQGRTDGIAMCSLSDEQVAELKAAASSDKGIFVPLPATIVDASGAILCTLEVRWHLKRY